MCHLLENCVSLTSPDGAGIKTMIGFEGILFIRKEKKRKERESEERVTIIVAWPASRSMMDGRHDIRRLTF